MNIVNVIQGSQKWLDLRATKFTASEAPAMMGASKYQSRDELLKMKATGEAKEISAYQQQIFDKGHQVEEMARPLVERMINDELFPATATSDEFDWMLASFDGITMLEDVVFEHKLFNQSLFASVQAGKLEPHYFWQLEQQLLVSGAEKAIFVCSDGTEDNYASCEYKSVPERREALIAGWQQFMADLSCYHAPVEEVKPEANGITALPALVIDIEGGVKSSNLATYEQVALDFINKINTDLVTDQDFADAEATVKFCDKAEKELDLVKKQALAKTADIDQLFRTVDTLKDAMRSKRLELNKLVKARKEAVKVKILTTAKNVLAEHISQINERLAIVSLPAINADFVKAMKGKRTVASLQSAANDELARAKVEANQLADKIELNLVDYRQLPQEHQALFSDLFSFVTKDNDDFKRVLEQRISDHKEREERRLAAERERIRAEEQAKAKREAETKAEAKTPEPAQANNPRLEEACAVLRNAETAAKTEPKSVPDANVTITRKEYEWLHERNRKLEALEAAGVDNWQGYDEAMAMLHDNAA